MRDVIKEGRQESTFPTDSAFGEQRNREYSSLFRKFIFLTLLCSLLPLLALGWWIYMHYSSFSESRMLDYFQSQVDHHRKTIESFLKERSANLFSIAYTHSRGHLEKQENLMHAFEVMNREYGSLTDLGLIDSQGKHLAYVGPYDLLDKNYSKAFWFQEVMEKGIYVSDMFMGFRKVPHFIIAVSRSENGDRWILRATIDTEFFRSMVENVHIGKTGEVYLLNREGVFQTSPRYAGKIMEKAPFLIGDPFEGTRIQVVERRREGEDSRLSRHVVARAWVSQPSWLLEISQGYAEAFGDVNYANRATLIFLHLGALIILIVVVFITRHMISAIRKRDEETERLNSQLMATGKLAAIGELAAGVAHEINNPLAIILTERQILLDMSQTHSNLDPEFRTQLNDSLNQIHSQTQRCKRITHNLLRFSRRTKSVIEPVDLNGFLGEVVELMEREARTCGVKFFTDFDQDLGPCLSDPSQLQQVFLNMITNAIDAHEGKPYGTIRITTRSLGDGKGAQIVFADTGSGISPENLGKIFDPFFTTKPVGKGTGLGLPICLSIMQRLGGNIEVKSEPGMGTEFTLSLPNSPQRRLEQSSENDQ